MHRQIQNALPLVFFLLFILVQALPVSARYYPGLYSGTYTGNDEGSWIFLFDNAGVPQAMKVSSNSSFTDFGTGQSDGDGNFRISFQSGMVFRGNQLNPEHVFGSWEHASLNNVGEFTGSQDVVQLIHAFSGVYTGSLTGYDTQTFSIRVNDDSTCVGHIKNSSTNATTTLTGLINANGFFIWQTRDGMGLSGAIRNGQRMTGVWSVSATGSTGSFTGLKDGVTDGDGEDDDHTDDDDSGDTASPDDIPEDTGGGCFLTMLGKDRSS
ncbi:MAG: hypothetical protein CSA22_01070 [Deltaproteobacteria bacterium]|nr:MAG: hypothetical protein CSA22_01070 [Deltaproteobacteria bacterium]